jgi:Transposase IS66 family
MQRWYLTRRFLLKSTMGKTVSYALSQWESLEVYLQESEIEIDNNLVENAIRPTALGKKNWLFFGDADAGERSAINCSSKVVRSKSLQHATIPLTKRNCACKALSGRRHHTVSPQLTRLLNCPQWE